MYIYILNPNARMKSTLFLNIERRRGMKIILCSYLSLQFYCVGSFHYYLTYSKLFFILFLIVYSKVQRRFSRLGPSPYMKYNLGHNEIPNHTSMINNKRNWLGCFGLGRRHRLTHCQVFYY